MSSSSNYFSNGVKRFPSRHRGTTGGSTGGGFGNDWSTYENQLLGISASSRGNDRTNGANNSNTGGGNGGPSIPHRSDIAISNGNNHSNTTNIEKENYDNSHGQHPPQQSYSNSNRNNYRNGGGSNSSATNATNTTNATNATNVRNHNPYSNTASKRRNNNNTYGNPSSNPRKRQFASSSSSYHQQQHAPLSNQPKTRTLDYNTYKPSLSNPKPTKLLPPNHHIYNQLNSQQRQVVESVLSGYSTFFTGPAGSGKSHILQYICSCLLDESVWSCIEEYSKTVGDDNRQHHHHHHLPSMPYKKKKIIITGTTGLSSCIAGGTTIHSFAGCATESELSAMLTKVLGNRYAVQRWRECDILIIDEVSMMPALFLDNLSAIASRARNDRRVFGGIQLVLCGDFFQLPPVNLEKNQFAFEAKVWPQIIQTSICLEQIYRQEGDTIFMELLNEARVGELSERSVRILREHARDCSNGVSSCCPPLIPLVEIKTEEEKEEEEEDTKLEVIDVDEDKPTNASTASASRNNKSKSTKKKSATKKKKKAAYKKRKSIKNYIRPTLLECKNAVVDRLNQSELSKLNGQNVRYKSRDQAMNQVYKAQLKHCQAPEVLNLKVGAHVILLKNIDSDKGLVNGVRGIIEDFALSSRPSDLPREYRKTEFPVVVFDSVPKKKINSTNDQDDEDDEDDEDEAITKTIEPTEWTNKVGDLIVSSRWQVPLRLGYSLTVHKSQGMTIDHLAVNLSDTFEYGQAYVALSRAKSLDKLILKGFREDAFKAHPTVKQFYAMLQGGKSPPQSTSSSSFSGKTIASVTKKQELIPAPNRFVRELQINQNGKETQQGKNISLTTEQLQRIEANRMRALEIRQKRMQSKP